jgi:SH3-like domain-containing protein
MTRIAAFLMVLLAAGAAQAQPSSNGGGKVLRYVSQRTDKAYLREGPTFAHRVLWQYRHRGYPFAVIAEFDIWRRVRAADGTTGWMSAAMLTDQRTVLVMGKGRAKITAKADGGKVVALADPGAIAALKACAPAACQIKGEGIDGWIARDRIWGVDANEVFDKLPRR